MKIGIIIIFHNNEIDINSKTFIKQVNQAKNIEFCLVNNASKDNTLNKLIEIKEARMDNVSIVDIKKFKSDLAAVRAGARFMTNQFNLHHLGYVSTNLINIKYEGLNVLIKLISENQKIILDYNINTIAKKEIKLTLFQSLFSIIDCLKKLKTNNHFIQLQYQRNL